MKARVVQPLNIRAEASDEGKILGTLEPGYIFDLAEKVTGKPHNGGSDQWYKDKYGFFYWSGGLEVSGDTSIISSASLPWYIKDFGIDTIWNRFGTRGEGVRIAILDTGYIEHPEFDHLKGFILSKNWARFTNSILDFDEGSHGTGVLGATASIGKQLYGTAPLATYIVVKTGSNVQSITPENVLNGLNWTLQQSPDIISMSFTSPVISEEIKTLISNAVAGGITVLASVDNQNPAVNRFPASLSGVIAVSAVGKNKDAALTTSVPGDYAALYGPGVFDKLPCATKVAASGYHADTGTSYATPWLAGVIALGISLNAGLTPAEIATTLRETGQPLNGNTDQTIVNPLSWIQRITSHT